MESHPAANAPEQRAELLVLDPERRKIAEVELTGEQVSVGRLPGANDIVLSPDPQRLVSRVGHCTFEHDRGRWFLVDGGGVNGTFLRRGDALEPVERRRALENGDVVCVLASLSEDGERRFFELVYHDADDSQATRAAALVSSRPRQEACLRYEPAEARLVLVRDGERREIQIRAQAHRLVRHMAERNAASGGAPALCTHDELIHAVWADEPMHTRTELAKLVWELRRALEPYGAADVIESERRRGYRLRTCPGDE
jgi:hypothetical protein